MKFIENHHRQDCRHQIDLCVRMRPSTDRIRGRENAARSEMKSNGHRREDVKKELKNEKKEQNSVRVKRERNVKRMKKRGKNRRTLSEGIYLYQFDKIIIKYLICEKRVQNEMTIKTRVQHQRQTARNDNGR